MSTPGPATSMAAPGETRGESGKAVGTPAEVADDSRTLAAVCLACFAYVGAEAAATTDEDTMPAQRRADVLTLLEGLRAGVDLETGAWG